MTANEAFDNFLKSLPRAERIAKIRDIKELCKKTNSVIYDWRHGRSQIDIAWQAKISKVVGEDIFTEVVN